MTDTTSSMVEFLLWLDERPRTYADAMEAWRSSCPRLTIWEDALADGLITLGIEGTASDRSVTLTARGRLLLSAAISR